MMALYSAGIGVLELAIELIVFEEMILGGIVRSRNGNSNAKKPNKNFFVVILFLPI